MPDKPKTGEGQEKKYKLDVHKVLIRTGFSSEKQKYYIEVKSLNNPLFRGRQYMSDPDDVEILFKNLKNKDSVYEFISGIYKEPTAMSLSKIFADEKKVRDEEKAKEIADMMAEPEAADEPAPEVPVGDKPKDDKSEEEPEEESNKTPGLFPISTKFNSLFNEVKKKLKTL